MPPTRQRPARQAGVFVSSADPLSVALMHGVSLAKESVGLVLYWTTYAKNTRGTQRRMQQSAQIKESGAKNQAASCTCAPNHAAADRFSSASISGVSAANSGGASAERAIDAASAPSPAASAI